MMTEEWGPWIEHDGRGFPEMLRGVVIEVIAELKPGIFRGGVGVVDDRVRTDHWDWANYLRYSPRFGWHWSRVIRYRTRRPRGLKVLENLLADLPEKVDE